MTHRIPKWLESRSEVNTAILSYLERFGAEVSDYTEASISLADFDFGVSLDGVAFSSFIATKDSLFYASLLKKALEIVEHAECIIDLGTGSSLPLISALIKANPKLEAVGIDLDPAAILTAQSNIDFFALSSKVKLYLKSIEGILDNDLVGSSAPKIVASNPPYVACPESERDSLLPVFGGEDGTLHLERILTHPFPDNTCLALQWGSLTNPQRMFNLIDLAYEVAHLQAWEVPFGKYTVLPSVNEHLMKLREQDLVAFSGQTGEKQTQIIFGAVLRLKCFGAKL